MPFQHLKYQNFLGGGPPNPPYGRGYPSRTLPARALWALRRPPLAALRVIKIYKIKITDKYKFLGESLRVSILEEGRMCLLGKGELSD